MKYWMKYWIQPVTLRREVSPRRFGLDQNFVFPSVGMAEFEFGAIPQAARAMRENWHQYTLSKVKCRGYFAFIWARKPNVDEARAFFRLEIRRGRAGIVPLGLRHTYGLTPYSGKEEDLERAWFNISGNPWVVCASENTALLWGSCMEDTKKPIYALADRDFPLRLFYLEEDAKKAISSLRPLADEAMTYTLLKATAMEGPEVMYATHLAVNGKLFCRFSRSSSLTPDVIHSLVNVFKAQDKTPTLWVEVPLEIRLALSAL